MMKMNLSEIQILISQIEGGLFKRTSKEFINSIINTLFENSSNYQVIFNKYCYARGRKSDTIFQNTDELWAPPYDYIKSGRCNLNGQSIFYASDGDSTIFPELRAGRGDIVTVGIILLESDEYHFSLSPIGEIYNISFTGKQRLPTLDFDRDSYMKMFNLDSVPISENDFKKHLLIDAFFAKVFSKTYQTELDYFVTCRLANLMYEKHMSEDMNIVKENTKGFKKIRSIGIYYPSVLSKGNNFALIPKNIINFSKWVQFKAFRVTRVLDYGIYDTELLDMTEMVNDGIKGNIPWIKDKKLIAKYNNEIKNNSIIEELDFIKKSID